MSKKKMLQVRHALLFSAFLDMQRMIFLCDMKADKLFASLNHYKKITI